MRIAVASASAEVAGGAETYLAALLPALRARGHDLVLVHEFPLPAGSARLGGADAAAISVDARGRSGALADLSAWRPDAVLVNRVADPALEGALLDRFPCAFFAHDYRGLCATGEKLWRFPHPTPCTRPLSVACLALDWVRGCGIRNPRSLAAGWALERRRRAHLLRYRRIVVASDHVRGVLVGNGVDGSRVVVNPPWPTDLAPLAAAPPPRRTAGTLLFMGRLVAAKGPLLAVEAVDRASALLGRRLRLIVAGEGPERERLVAEAAARRVEVELTGWITGDHRRSALGRADLLLLPSLWPEPFGLVGIEAAGQGTPAAAFDVGGVRDWLAPGESGELAEPGSPGSLARAVVRALEVPARLHALRVGAWTRSLRFTRDLHVLSLERTLGELRARARREDA
jgi:glycosyltransferase involved in cell wall biosynthesis